MPAGIDRALRLCERSIGIDPEPYRPHPALEEQRGSGNKMGFKRQVVKASHHELDRYPARHKDHLLPK